jgi:hypothetical protein
MSPAARPAVIICPSRPSYLPIPGIPAVSPGQPSMLSLGGREIGIDRDAAEAIRPK